MDFTEILKFGETYFLYNGEKFLIPSDCSLNRGCSITSTVKKEYNYTKTSYTLKNLRKPQQPTYSCSFIVNNVLFENVYEYLISIEKLVGKNVEFCYCGVSFGVVIVKNMDFTLSFDDVGGFFALSISISIDGNKPVVQKQPQVRGARQN